MSPFTIHQKFLEAFACAHVSDGFMEEDGDRMLGCFMKLQETPLSEVKRLKDTGNRLFRQNYFDRAANCYDEACKLLGLCLGMFDGEDIQFLSDLAVSLNSNLAACALKLEEYRAAFDLCSMILDTFSHNVKALFRRAVDLMKLKRFLEAETDLMEALVVEPRNKDVLRELDVVKGHLLLKENGKRVLEFAPTVSVDRSCKKHVIASESETEIQDSESGIMEVTEQHSDVSIKDNESVNLDMVDTPSACGIDLSINLEKNERIPNKSVLEFSKKGGVNSRLRISGQAYQRLLQGSQVGYYHKKELSTITIRMLSTAATKEGGITRDHCKMKTKKRRSKKRNSKMAGMNEDKSSLKVINVIHGISSRGSSICDVSSSSSSICDNFSPPDIQILQGDSTVDAPNSCLPVSAMNDATNTSICSQAHKDANEFRPFLFSARPRPKKCKFSSIDKQSCAPTIRRFCRYPSNHHGIEKKRVIISKKNLSQGDESPRRNLSTFSTSRLFFRKFLRPRGVSVSCCSYSPEAKLIKKRKEVSTHLMNSDRPLKKTIVFANPTLSLFSFSNNVIIKSDSPSQVGTM